MALPRRHYAHAMMSQLSGEHQMSLLLLRWRGQLVVLVASVLLLLLRGGGQLVACSAPALLIICSVAMRAGAAGAGGFIECLFPRFSVE